MQTILIGFIVIGLGYLLIWGLCYAASKRREAWERANKQMWETYDRQKQWDRLNEICKQETINDIERLR